MSDETSTRPGEPDEAPTPIDGRTGIPEHRVIMGAALKAFAHPLRVNLFDALSTYGPATASQLAERFGESSGATSYHLRQLARHGVVRELEGRGNGRERWWERVPGSIDFGDAETRSTESGRATSRIVLRELTGNRQRLLSEFIEHGHERLDAAWAEAGTISLSNLPLTLEQTQEAARMLDDLVTEFSRRWRGQNVPGMRPVQIQINAFPVIDGEITPEEES